MTEYKVSKLKGQDAIDYIPDPFEGAVIIDHKGGPLLRSSDGYLYSPLKDGYNRNKVVTHRLSYCPRSLATTDDSYVDVSADVLAFLATALKEGASMTELREDIVVQFISAYQNSGGALGLYIGWGDVGGEVVIGYKSGIATGTVTNMMTDNLEFPVYDPDNPTRYLGFKWSAAAGAADRVMYQVKLRKREDELD